MLWLLSLQIPSFAQFAYTTNNGTATIRSSECLVGSVTIPVSINGLPVTSIADYAFFGCASLTGVTIPDSVTSIGVSTFQGCASLTSVTIGNNVRSIGGSAFYGCTSLTNVTIPNRVTSIGNFAFLGCTSLSTITVEALNSFYSSVDGVLLDKSKTTVIQYPEGKAGSYTILDSVRSIGSAFFGCTRLTGVTFGTSVTSIPSSAFYGCTSLTSVTLGNSVRSIPESTFQGCTRLSAITVEPLNSLYSSVDGVLLDKSQTTLIQYPKGKAGNYTIPNSVTSIRESAFSACASLTGVTIPGSVTSIGGSAFYGCTSLINVTIPDSVTSIETSAFYGCNGLTSITLGNSVTSIRESAFSACASLTDVRIPDSATSIGGGAFYGCTSLTNVTIPNRVTNIGGWAFNGCTSLTSVTLGNSVTSIGESALSGCTSLNNVTIPNRVTSIGGWALYGCTSLTNVTLGSSVGGIGYFAFSGCTRLSTITVEALNSYYSSVDGVLFDKSQTKLIQYPEGRAGNFTIPNSANSIGFSAFRGCTRLSAITVEALNSYYSSVDGVLFDKSQTTLIQYPKGKAGNYTLPNRVTSIPTSAFSGCTRLTSVTLGNGVTSIPSSAFSGCSSLTNVTIPDSVTSIESSTFHGCTSLANVTVPNRVTSIGSSAFYGCTSLTSVTLGNGVTSIESSAFHGCTSLSTITVEALNSFYSSVDGVLFDTSQTTLIRCPEGKAGNYTIPNRVTSIGGEAFSGCTRLTSVTLGNSVTSIGDYAFSNCTCLTSVTIPNSVTSIGGSVFYGCTSLTKVYFKGNTPNSIAGGVFGYSDKVVVHYLPGTIGWGSVFDGRPTVLWNPQVLTSDASFGVRAGQFGFTITGTGSLVVVVEASADLANPGWTPVGSHTLIGGSSYFSDPQWTNYPARCYRLSTP